MKNSSILRVLPVIVWSILPFASHAADLKPAEIASLQLMREEEKMAHDVYVFLHKQYGDQPFSNISQAEERHTNAILYLMEKYAVEDKGSNQPGNFNNPELQAMYDKLIATGSKSRESAFVVGILIEEIDIADLDEALTITDNPDLIQVYMNLRRGSQNHLRAFNRNLSRVSKSPDKAYKRIKNEIGKS